MSDANSENDVLEPPCSKKIKIDEQNVNRVRDTLLNLKDFVPVKVLNNNTNRKTVCVQGTIRDKSGVALVLLEKNAFKEEELDDTGYFAVDTKLYTFFQNDIYGNFECYPRPEINGVKTTIIYPATDKIIGKFSQQEVHIVIETPELYKNLTLPYIEKEQNSVQMMDPEAPVLFLVQNSSTLQVQESVQHIHHQEPLYTGEPGQQQYINQQQPLFLGAVVPVQQYAHQQQSIFIEGSVSVQGYIHQQQSLYIGGSVPVQQYIHQPVYIEQSVPQQYINQQEPLYIEESVPEYIEETTLAYNEESSSEGTEETSEELMEEDSSESIEENSEENSKEETSGSTEDALDNIKLETEFFEDAALEYVEEVVCENVDESVSECVEISESIEIFNQEYIDNPSQECNTAELVSNKIDECTQVNFDDSLPEFTELVPYIDNPTPANLDEHSQENIEEQTQDNTDESPSEFIGEPENVEKFAQEDDNQSLVYLEEQHTDRPTPKYIEEQSSESTERSVEEYVDEASSEYLKEHIDNIIDPRTEMEIPTKEFIDKPIPEYIDEPSLDYTEENNSSEHSQEYVKAMQEDMTESTKGYIDDPSLDYIEKQAKYIKESKQEFDEEAVSKHTDEPEPVHIEKSPLYFLEESANDNNNETFFKNVEKPAKENLKKSTPEVEEAESKFIDKPVPIYIEEPSMDGIDQPMMDYIDESLPEYEGESKLEYLKEPIPEYIEENTIDYIGHTLENIERKTPEHVDEPMLQDMEIDVSQYIRQPEVENTSEPINAAGLPESKLKLTLESTEKSIVQPDNSSETKKPVECLEYEMQDPANETVSENIVQPVEKHTLSTTDVSTLSIEQPSTPSIQESKQVTVTPEKPDLVAIPEPTLVPIEQPTIKCVQPTEIKHQPSLIHIQEHTLECIQRSAVSNQPTLITIQQPIEPNLLSKLEPIHQSSIIQPNGTNIQQTLLSTEPPPLVPIQPTLHPSRPTITDTPEPTFQHAIPPPSLVPIKRKARFIVPIKKRKTMVQDSVISTKDKTKELSQNLYQTKLRSNLYKRQRANERKRRFLDKLTPEQTEAKRLKDLEYYHSRRPKKKSIKEVTDKVRKERIRQMWRRNTASYSKKHVERKYQQKAKNKTHLKTTDGKQPQATNNQSDESSNSQTEAINNNQPKTTIIYEPETNKNQPETTNNRQSEVINNNHPETANDEQSETTEDNQSEKANNKQFQTNSNNQTEKTNITKSGTNKNQSGTTNNIQAETKNNNQSKEQNNNHPVKENYNPPEKENCNQPEKESNNQSNKENTNQSKEQNNNQSKKEDNNQSKQ